MDELELQKLLEQQQTPNPAEVEPVPQEFSPGVYDGMDENSPYANQNHDIMNSPEHQANIAAQKEKIEAFKAARQTQAEQPQAPAAETEDPRLAAAIDQQEKYQKYAMLLRGIQEIASAKSISHGYKPSYIGSEMLAQKGKDAIGNYKAKVESERANKKEKRDVAMHEVQLDDFQTKLAKSKIDLEDDKANNDAASDNSKAAQERYIDIQQRKIGRELTEAEKANIQQRTAKDIFKYLPQLQDDVAKVLQYKELELNRTFDQDYKNRQLDQSAELLREQIAARKETARLAAEAKVEAAKEKRTEAGTEGQKAVDKKYATDYNDFTSKGQVNVKNSISKLEALASEMEKDQGIGESGGGRISSILPDVMRDRDAIRRRDASRNEANRTLKALFPGALSDAEREAAAKEFYNDALSNEENAKILRQKISDLKSGLTQELAKAQYYEKNGTLKGFAGSSLQNDRKTQSDSGPYGDETERNGKKYKWNPTAGKYQLIGQ